MKSSSPIRSICRLAAAALMPTLAVAQPAPQDANNDGVQEIVVTAQRREQNLQSTPVAITALTSDAITARQITNVEALTANTPGLFIAQVSASPNALQVGMRGALEQNGGTVTSESPVAIYIDDVYQSRLSAANYDLADVERVEVLRGPQGTLYGRNSMTGAIKFITRQPDGKTWFNTDISYGRWSEARAKLSAGAPLGANLAMAATAFIADRSDGWQHNDTLNKDVGKFNRYGAQFTLATIDESGLQASLTARYTASLTDGQHFVPLNYATNSSASSNFYNTLSPKDGDGDLKQKAVSLRLGYDFGGVTLRSISAYQSLTDFWAIDFSGGVKAPPPPGNVIAGFFRVSDGKQHQFTEELQLLGKGLDDRLNWITGAFYFDERGDQVFAVNDLASFGIFTKPSTMVNKSKSVALYGQVDYKLTDKLTASLGLRYSDDTKKFAGTIANSFEVPAFGVTGTLVPVAHNIDAKVTTYRANLQYDFSADVMAYLTASKGYRAAGFNSLVLADPVNFGAPYKPEFAKSYELGVKIDAFERKLRLNAAAYLEKLTDLQTLALVANGGFITQNAAASEIKGLELEATLVPFNGLTLFASFTYMDGKYTKLDAGAVALTTGATDLPLVSKNQIQVGGTYEFGLPNSAKLAFAADYGRRSKYQVTAALDPFSITHPGGRANASITYTTPSSKMDLYLAVANVTDAKTYYNDLDFITGVFGYKAALEPRRWRVGLRYRFQ